MGLPRNNLKTHLQWARDVNAFFPSRSEIETANNDYASAAKSAAPASMLPPAAATTVDVCRSVDHANHNNNNNNNNNNIDDPGEIVLTQNDVITISDSDSDLEFLAGIKRQPSGDASSALENAADGASRVQSREFATSSDSLHAHAPFANTSNTDPLALPYVNHSHPPLSTNAAMTAANAAATKTAANANAAANVVSIDVDEDYGVPSDSDGHELSSGGDESDDGAIVLSSDDDHDDHADVMGAKKVDGFNDNGQSMLLQTPIKQSQFTLSEAPQTNTEPKREMGFVFTEKIALLERKIDILLSAMRRSGVYCSTAELDAKIADVEQRINRFGEDIDEEDDKMPGAVDILSSPAMFSGGMSPADSYDSRFPQRGLPLDVHTDAFDADDADVMEVEGVRTMVPSSPFAFCDRTVDDDDIEVMSVQGTPIYSVEDETASQRVRTHAEAQQYQYPWTKETMHILRTRFGLNNFRANQAEAVNETLGGNDVVVLMPTGGGKSLCYQLPALVTSGKTQGTTLVISPLISLMQDQVYHLQNRNIQAEMLNSRLSAAERNTVFARLRGGDLQLLYLSPEMLSVSGAMKAALQQLYSGGRLARIVIDEAHCVSSWGHDFRPDYMALTQVKHDFPSTPIMALTATANERVLLDIVNCLRPNPKVLKQSFNRQNLFYEVRAKTANVLQDIAGICRQFSGKSGIIYCNSKKNCEDTAASLTSLGIRASFYHAGLDQDLRASVQTDWQKGHTQVVCATIAFGMGIDKPDVRYVVHLTLPRNVEGYYQETGRAGRDGKPSRCVLFYTYRDVQMLQRLIMQDRELSPAIRDHHKSLLIRVMQYCENSTDCRRKQVLQYFNEDFDPRMCRMQCDNCRKMQGQVSVRKDMTQQTRQILQVINESSQGNSVTTQQLIDILIGRSSSKIKTCKFNTKSWFGCLRREGLVIVERLAHSLLSEKVLEEYAQYNKSRYPQTYVRAGPNSRNVLHGVMAIQLAMPTETQHVPAAAAATAASGQAPRQSYQRPRSKNRKRARYVT